jgi:hypothetical protein
MKFFTGKQNYEGGRKPFKLSLPEWFDDMGIDYKDAPRGEIILEDCPSCNRTNKLYVDSENGVAQCKYSGCDFSEGISPIELVAKLLSISKGRAYILCFGKDEQKQTTKADVLGDDWLEDIKQKNKITKKKKKKELVEIVFPPLTESLNETHSVAWSYLINRGMSKEDIQKVDMKIIPFENYKDYSVALQRAKYSPEDIKKYIKYVNRVIFPVEVEGKLFGYVARDYTNKVPKKYKVMNSEGSFRADVFWNFDRVKDSETIIICEGFMDAVKTGLDQSIAILGADMSSGQFDLLRKTKAKKIIIALDQGTELKQNAIFDELFLDFPGAIYKIELPELLTQKKSLLNESIKKILEEFTKEEISYFTENEMIISYSIHDKITTRLDEEPKWFLSGKNALSKYELENLQEFMKHAEFKDAGDYSKEEMNEFKSQVVLFQKYKDIDLNDD